jgi:guanyl-specific ribonuclease Sa
MNMSGRIAKSQIPTRSQAWLPTEARFALIEAKNLIKAGLPLKQFRNQQGRTALEGPPLPAPTQGCEYYEIQVGQAREGDPEGEAGSKRLVLEVNKKARQLMETYYTDEHYEKFSFLRIV